MNLFAATMLKCAHNGCGKTFDAESNTDSSCTFHPGHSIFHDRLKGWSCCTKRTDSFDEFLQIPGCASGTHAVEKPREQIHDQKKKQTDSIAMPTSVVNGVEIYGTTTAPIEATRLLKDNHSTDREPIERPIPQDPEDAVITEGTKCRRLGCDGVYQSPSSRMDDCIFHKGYSIIFVSAMPNFLREPVFHEGSKGYSCCKRRVLEFEEFLKIPGCYTDRHLFIKPAHGAEERTQSTMKCREDFYQTQKDVIASIYAKKIDQTTLRIEFQPQEVEINLYFKTNCQVILDFTFSDSNHYSTSIPLYDVRRAARMLEQC